MGFLWDLIQHGQIEEQANKSRSLEQRVTQLEADLLSTRRLLLAALERLETHLRIDLDEDGKVR